MRAKDNNGKKYRTGTSKKHKDILSEADDIILNLISKTEPCKKSDESRLKIMFTGFVCTLFALAVIYVIVKY